MDATEKTLTLFTTRMRQMILRFDELKKEKTRLEDMLSERDAKIAELEARLAQASMDYESLKMARMIEVTDGDVEGAQKRISKLIRDVNKCITLLSEKYREAMGESDKEILRIRLHVYDTDMTVTIPRAEEECYRAAAKLITDVVNNYSAVYKDRKGEKEILYMALIDISLRYQKETRKHDILPVTDILTKLTSEIEEALDSE